MNKKEKVIWLKTFGYIALVISAFALFIFAIPNVNAGITATEPECANGYNLYTNTTCTFGFTVPTVNTCMIVEIQQNNQSPIIIPSCNAISNFKFNVNNKNLPLTINQYSADQNYFNNGVKDYNTQWTLGMDNNYSESVTLTDFNLTKTYYNLPNSDVFIFWFSFLLSLVGLFLILYVFFGRRYKEAEFF